MTCKSTERIAGKVENGDKLAEDYGVMVSGAHIEVGRCHIGMNEIEVEIVQTVKCFKGHV